MNILHVNATLGLIEGGGTGERTLQMTRFLSKEGITCTVLSTDLGWSETQAARFAGSEVILLPCLWERFYFPRLEIGKMYDAVAKADVIHLMGHWTTLNVLVYLIARRLRKPYVICSAGSLKIYGRSKWLKRFFNFLVGSSVIRHASYCIAVTPSEIPHFKAHGVAADRIVVIPNGIDPGQYQACDDAAFRQRYGIGSQPFILLMGRLNEIKGPDLLLQAFCETQSELQGYDLVFAGPDEGMRRQLEAVVAMSKLESRVHFLGYVGGDDKARAYRAAQLVVIPSRQEAMSIVVLEAGVVGKAVLLTDQCGFNEVEAIGGGCVVAATVEGLRQGLRTMLADPGRLEEMGKSLQQVVLARFTWHSIVAEYLSLYRRILGSANREVMDGRSRHAPQF